MHFLGGVLYLCWKVLFAITIICLWKQKKIKYKNVSIFLAIS